MSPKTDAKELAARLKLRARDRAAVLRDIGGRNAEEKAATWEESAAEICEAAAALEAQAGLAEALAELELAADRVYHDLEHRISTASSYAVPVFDGVADLHDAIGHARAALARAAGGGDCAFTAYQLEIGNGEKIDVGGIADGYVGAALPHVKAAILAAMAAQE